MNRMKKLLYLFFISFCLLSCKNKAADFNNNLVNIQRSVLKEVQVFGKEMTEPNDSLAAHRIQPRSEEIALFIDDKIKEAQKLTAPSDGESLKNAIIMQLQFEKDIVGKIGRLTQQSIPNEERLQIETDLLSSQNRAQSLEDSIRIAQEVFAKQYKFKLE